MIRPVTLIRISLVLLTLCVSAAAHAQSVSEQYLLAAANNDRAARGLAPVHLDGLLYQAALGHAREMARHGGISHQFSGEPDLAARAGDAGVRFSLVTENVAEAPTAVIIHDLWMKSEGHRANLLDPHVDEVGIAVINVRGQLYAVEDFAHGVEHLSNAEQEAAVASLLVPSGLRVAAGNPDARQTCQLSTGYVGARQPWFVMRYTASSLDRLPDQLTDKLATGRYHQAAVGACTTAKNSPFTSYNIAVLLYP